MRFSWLLFAVASTVVCIASAQNEIYLYHKCSEANYTSSSIYQKNRNTLLSSLSSNNDIDYGFYNMSEGESIDRVNALALCRGDIRLSVCRKCVNFSTSDLPSRCPNQKEAIGWYDHCMLRYSNQSIFRTLEEDPAFYESNANKVSNATLFDQTVDDLLSILRDQASSGDSRLKFAIGDVKYDNFTTIHGLVQCTPDLTEMQCTHCLDRAFIDIAKVFPEQEGGRIHGPSCNFRYEIYPFYEIPLPPSPPPPPAIASPSPTATIVAPTGGGSDKIRNIIISVVSLVCFMILIVCTFIFLRIRKRKERVENGDEIGADSLQLDFGTVKAATNNFSIDNKLGQGGFGSVYKTC